MKNITQKVFQIALTFLISISTTHGQTTINEITDKFFLFMQKTLLKLLTTHFLQIILSSKRNLILIHSKLL